MESAVYKGKVHHERVHPKRHAFDYTMGLFWLKLSELDELAAQSNYFAIDKFAPHCFRFSDYFVHEEINNTQDLTNAVKSKMTELGASASLEGEFFFLGQLRSMGIFFSPVNFYFHRHSVSEKYDYMLAEVSNTPWNQRHYYLVDLASQKDTKKAFHVSPFNPIDMTYKWQVAQPGETLNLALSCYQENRHFTASLAMKKQEIDAKLLRNLTLRMPSTTLFSLMGIYWQALKLFIKRTPVYGHPGSVQSHVQENNNVSK